MTIPDYQTLMLPLLQIAGDGKEHSNQGLMDQLAKKFGLTENELEQPIPSGGQPIFYNRVHGQKLTSPRLAFFDRQSGHISKSPNEGKRHWESILTRSTWTT
jgi:restriction endonuclease Mrr